MNFISVKLKALSTFVGYLRKQQCYDLSSVCIHEIGKVGAVAETIYTVGAGIGFAVHV